MNPNSTSDKNFMYKDDDVNITYQSDANTCSTIQSFTKTSTVYSTINETNNANNTYQYGSMVNV